MLLVLVATTAVLFQTASVSATGSVVPVGSAEIPCSLSCSPEQAEKGYGGMPGGKGETGEMGHRGPPGRFPLSHHWHIITQPGMPGRPGRYGRYGAPGPRGETGEKGLQGPPGSTMGKGDPGPQGAVGNAGPKGSMGDKGLTGLPGPEGDRGNEGSQGNDGAPGQPGNTGSTGDVGDQGDGGSRGERGEQGNAGPKGESGDVGDVGFPSTGGAVVVGRKGDKGLPGEPGDDSRRKGNKGFNGLNGEPGPNITNVPNVVDKSCDQSNEGQIYHDPTTREIAFCDGEQWKCAETRQCVMQCTEGTFYREITTDTGLPVRLAADIVLIVDDSGSMKDEQDWIPDAAAALEKALLGQNIGNGALKNQYFVVLFGNLLGGNFRSNRTTVVDVDGRVSLSINQVRSAMRKFSRRGNAEDGYQAVELALAIKELRRDNPDVALNIGLVTDEPRDPFANTAAGTESSMQEIVAELVARRAKLNLFGEFAFDSASVDNIIAVDYQGKIYSSDAGVEADTRGFQSSVVNVSFQANDESCRAFVQYAPLAMATGGAVWNLKFVDNTAGSSDLRQSFTDAMARIKVEEISQQSVCVECVNTCEGPQRIEKQVCSEKVDQIFCRCKANRGADCEQQRFANREEFLQSVQYDYSSMYRNCDQHVPSYPRHFDGWCWDGWPFDENRPCGLQVPAK